MPTYRLYHLDPHNGHIAGADEFYAADDVSAIYELQQQDCDHPRELWQLGRKVTRLDAAPAIGPRRRTRGAAPAAKPTALNLGKDTPMLSATNGEP